MRELTHARCKSLRELSHTDLTLAWVNSRMGIFGNSVGNEQNVFGKEQNSFSPKPNSSKPKPKPKVVSFSTINCNASTQIEENPSDGCFS